MVEEIQEARELVVADLPTLRLLADPLRLRLVSVFAAEPGTVKDAARRLGVAAGKLYYHVDLLERSGLIVVTDTRVVSGVTEKRYAAAARDIRVDRKLLALQAPDAALDAMLAAVLDATRSEAERSARAGAMRLDDEDVVMMRLNVRTSREKAADLQREIRALVARAAEEARRGGDAEYNMTVAYFPLPPERAS